MSTIEELNNISNEYRAASKVLDEANKTFTNISDKWKKAIDQASDELRIKYYAQYGVKGE